MPSYTENSDMRVTHYWNFETGYERMVLRYGIEGPVIAQVELLDPKHKEHAHELFKNIIKTMKLAKEL